MKGFIDLSPFSGIGSAEAPGPPYEAQRTQGFRAGVSDETFTFESGLSD
jgi:hypothetical protein